MDIVDPYNKQLIELLNSMPRAWLLIFRRELEKVDLQELRDSEIDALARRIIRQVNQDYRENLRCPGNEAELVDLVKLVTPAPSEWVRALAEGILEEHPELAWGEFISPPA